MKRDEVLSSEDTEDGFYRIILETLYDDFAELWNMWFGLEDSERITELLRHINHKFNLGLVEEVENADPRGEG